MDAYDYLRRAGDEGVRVMPDLPTLDRPALDGPMVPVNTTLPSMLTKSTEGHQLHSEATYPHGVPPPHPNIPPKLSGPPNQLPSNQNTLHNIRDFGPVAPNLLGDL